MALKDLLEVRSRSLNTNLLSPTLRKVLHLNEGAAKQGISEERVELVIPIVRQYISFWREYPDLFVDFLVRGFREEASEGEFRFFFYQRIFLRAIFRYQYVYAVYPRAFSKSFLSVLALILRSILYPRCHLFVTSGGKEQAAAILRDKVTELCQLIPTLDKEIDRRRGKTTEGKDSVRYLFYSGSILENMAARESSRGKRFHAGLIEECVGVDGKILQEVIIPTMAVSRRCLDGTTQENEPLNKSQVYVTTAGYKGTFPYEKLISLLLRSVTQPDKAIILGGTWRLPVAVGLQSRNFIRDQREEGTYNEASFGREYESSWSGTAENGFFDGEAFDKQRIIPLAEYEASGKRGENSYYVLAVDVGRFGCQSVVSVIKVNPRTQGDSIKRLVNIVTMNDEHFEAQAIKLKRLFYAYKARRIIIDGNGLGAGLLDFMTRSQIDELGQSYPDFGVYGGTNPASVEQYKKQHTEETEENAMYIMKANLPINTAAHTNLQSQVATGHIKFLIEPSMAKIKLLGTKKGQLMSPEQRNEYLLPFTLTSILKEEMLNLREENAGINIILKSVNKRLGHDKVSSLEYGLYYIKEEEETKKKKKTGRFKDYMFIS